MDRDEMLRVLRAFDREALEYVLIGAAAIGFHGVVRATEDLDVVIRASEDNVERLKRAFRAAYGGDLYFDVMTRLGEAASFETVSQESKGIDGIRMHVATRVRPAGGVVIGVQRFRSIEEMFAAPVIVSPGEGFERFARHCQRYWTIAPRVYPRGVFRFKTIAEAQAARNGSRLTGTRSPCR
jgi:hypothetical protein